MAAAEWEMVIGLEVHCELLTKTKLFCSCPNTFGNDPNTNICPVCLGLPGSLPVLNRQAVELAMRIGLALGCTVKPSVFHRKNYFYPDMPKDYQVSQYDEPINVAGGLELPNGKVVRIERAHIEEDTGKSTHVGGSGRINDSEFSLVDYNRAGVPLVEIVSAPDIADPEEARAYVSELRSILVATGASDGKMEEGSMRVDANVSVRHRGSTEFGTRCEIKNLNSLRSLGRAITYEADRQIALIESGERIVQETRHFDEGSGSTSSMRSKEEANDYRYFPEPDLVLLDPEESWVTSVGSSLPPLPAERRHLLRGMVELNPAIEQQITAVVEQNLDSLVTGAVGSGADPRLAISRAANEAAARADESRKLSSNAFAKLIAMESAGKLTATQAKTVLAEMIDTVASGGSPDPEAIASAKGFEEMAESALSAIVDEVIAANPGEWERFCEGDQKVTGFLVGQIMKSSKGKADGKAVNLELAKRKG